ncbi:IS200/IS605 family transposase, partial [Candidatus Poribacteria bacterium]|nr:IS200/IS605 family transposase [Candidatus Poribacteria bacterium]
MADTYTQLYIHIVFAVKGRQHLIPKQHKEALHQYITRIITNKKQTLIRINSMPDHIHILIGMKPDIALSDLVRDIKANSSKFINKKGWVAGKFEWQTGFGAFSYSRSQLDVVVNYINNQEAHHSHLTFREEYLAFLKRFDVPYNPKY